MKASTSGQADEALGLTKNDLEYTFGHLARLDLLIRAQVFRFRAGQPARGDDEFRGLYIPDEQVDALLDRSLAPSSLLIPDVRSSDQVDKALSAATAVGAQLDDTKTGAHDACRPLRLERLRSLFGLSRLERDIMLVALAAEIDLKYERLFAYLQDDVTKKRPTVDLTLRLLCATAEDHVSARRLFEPSAPLIRWDLITLHEDPNARRAVLLSRYLKLDERIAAYLLGSDTSDSRLQPLTDRAVSAGRLPPSIMEWLERVGAKTKSTTSGDRESDDARTPIYLLHGRYGSGRRAAAHALAGALDKPLLLLDAASVIESNIGVAQVLRLAYREAMLTGALLGWTNADVFLDPKPTGESPTRLFIEALAGGPVPTVLVSEKAWEPARRFYRRPFVRLAVPDASYAERRTLWATRLAGLQDRGPDLNEEDLTALAGRFRLTPGQIEDALVRAQTLAWSRDEWSGRISTEDIDAACRAQAQHHLGSLARQLTPRYTWDDIVLPQPQLATLRFIATMIRQRSVVYGQWGFDRKLAMGKGVITMFSGPSGTGKTMAAEILARDLGFDLYKIDLSAVVNKYIGETEKNLERLFSDAENTDTILFFDEADALFGKRSAVSDAHDRYANIETGYLLQRTEEYNGLVILASNLPKNVDEAFLRRLHFTVNFPLPEEAERLEIWRRTFPSEAPTESDLDLPFLARRLKITGGNIRNIILAAAFLAAEDRGSIAMRHLVIAARYEFQKIGKMVTERDFEQYFTG